MNLLFICSRNKWRSRTAEVIFKNNGLHQVRSAGTAASAQIKVTHNLIAWADVIFVMEDKHLSFLRQTFPTEVAKKETHVMHIPDEYQYMDTELVELLKASVGHFI